ncbi:MAG: HAD family phosphatase [Polyangiaceae bacterium]|nr:HAD family phosphatase [Polyangiaceae bacterium]
MKPATIFDFNGVLVDDEEIHLQTFRDVLGPMGIEISSESYWNTYIGFDDVGGFEAMLRDAGRQPTRAEIDELVELKKPHYLRRANQELKTFPGAAALIRHRASLGPVVVCSGALRDEVELGLKVLGVRDLVDAIFAAEDTTVSKPDPEGYLKSIEFLRTKVGDDAQRALVIEDSVAGIHAAKAAGLPCIAVEHSYPREKLVAAGADQVVKVIAAIDADVVDSVVG